MPKVEKGQYVLEDSDRQVLQQTENVLQAITDCWDKNCGKGITFSDEVIEFLGDIYELCLDLIEAHCI